MTNNPKREKLVSYKRVHNNDNKTVNGEGLNLSVKCNLYFIRKTKPKVNKRFDNNKKKIFSFFRKYYFCALFI